MLAIVDFIRGLVRPLITFYLCYKLNDVFNLDFEVFGTEGDVTDRKSNALDVYSAVSNVLLVGIFFSSPGGRGFPL